MTHTHKWGWGGGERERERDYSYWKTYFLQEMSEGKVRSVSFSLVAELLQSHEASDATKFLHSLIWLCSYGME